MSTAIHQAEQELDHDDVAAPTNGQRRGRHAKSEPPPRRRLHPRRRWPFVIIAVIALAALFAPPPSSGVSTTAKETTPDRSAQMANALKLLSTGAPRNAVVLTNSPLHAVGPQVQTSSVVSGLAANGIPTVALNAYRVAASRMDNTSSCGIDWSLLAGIGRVESNHGRFGGATLGSDGTSTPKILGPALNGQGFAFIRDTDHGAIDGDTTTDRAVGPMQFIPATWRSYAVDGNGDGVQDPFNVNDAALAAAHYLCVAGGNLATDAGQRQAVMAYNHSDSYVAEVLALAHAYAAGIPVSDIPLVGNTTGSIPAPSPTFAYAPAAPGPAIGASDNTPANGATVGNDPSATAQPASSQPASGGGGTTTTGGGTTTTGGGGGGTSTPVTGGGGSGSGGGTTGGGTTGGGSGGTPSGGGTSGGSPVPVIPPVIPPVTNPLPGTGTGGGTPTPPSTPAPAPVQLIAGVTCNLLGILGAPAPIAGLPTCPVGTPLP